MITQYGEPQASAIEKPQAYIPDCPTLGTVRLNWGRSFRPLSRLPENQQGGKEQRHICGGVLNLMTNSPDFPQITRPAGGARSAPLLGFQLAKNQLRMITDFG